MKNFDEMKQLTLTIVMLERYIEKLGGLEQEQLIEFYNEQVENINNSSDTKEDKDYMLLALEEFMARNSELMDEPELVN